MQSSKSGKPTLTVSKHNRLYTIHSRYDPVGEARKWLSANVSGQKESDLIILGLGLGYHVQVAAEQFPERKILVWEFNEQYVQWLEAEGLLNGLLQNTNVKLQVSSNVEDIKGQLLPLLDAGLDILVYFPALELIPEELQPLREAIDKLVLSLRTIRRRRYVRFELFHKSRFTGSSYWYLA